MLISHRGFIIKKKKKKNRKNKKETQLGFLFTVMTLYILSLTIKNFNVTDAFELNFVSNLLDLLTRSNAFLLIY